MKFNWGTGIVIVSLLFMSFIVTLVVKTYHHKVDLVSEDYYNQELDFQNRINKMNNVKDSTDKVTWEIEEDKIIFLFPENIDSTLSGTIEFFRPSDSGKDVIFSIKLDTKEKQFIEKKILLHGLYRVKIEWLGKGKTYYMEEDIFVQ